MSEEQARASLHWCGLKSLDESVEGDTTMTDIELDALEASAMAVREAFGCEKSLQAEADFVRIARPRRILALIAELRQARGERDWLAENMPNNVCPAGKAECTGRVPTAGGKACYACLMCWLDAAREATCQKD